MRPLRVSLVGAGRFGSNHARVIHSLPQLVLDSVVDPDRERGMALAAQYAAAWYPDVALLPADVDAAIVAAPTSLHESLGAHLLEAGTDVLIEKPIASTSAGGLRLANQANRLGRVLQVGHLERFNPAVRALEQVVTVPLFFEIHRLSVFTPRSLDVDVVLDLMIHDLDIVLHLSRQAPSDVQAAGISVLSGRVDIANVRLSFESGCVANLTASRVSTEQVRKLRLFQPGEYISLDYSRQDGMRLALEKDKEGGGTLAEKPIAIEKAEPLRLELQAFFECVRTRTTPLVDAYQASTALQAAEHILAKIGEHTDQVRETLRTFRTANR